MGYRFFGRGKKKPSSYAPLFYVRNNIIGYTGELERMPTVYFNDGEHHGHITQAHSDPSNIGREMVQDVHADGYTYVIRNEEFRESGVLVERAVEGWVDSRGKMIGQGHLSRSKFTSFDHMGVRYDRGADGTLVRVEGANLAKILNALMIAVRNFPYMKEHYNKMMRR